MMDVDDVMDVEIPDLPEFDMLEVVDGPHEDSSNKVLEEWRKPESPLDDVVDEIMEMDVQMGEDLLDDKFFYEDPCLSPTSALDDLVFSNTSLDDKELTLFAYPEENETAAAAPASTVNSNIPTPPPSMSSFNYPNPKPVSAAVTNRAPVSPAPVPSRSAAVVPRVNVPHVALPPHVGSRPPVPIHHYPHYYPPHHHHPHHPHVHPPHPHPPVRPPPPPPPPADATKPAPGTMPPPAAPTKSRSRPKQKKAPPKLNYIPAPPHMQPQPIAAAAAAAGAKRAAAAHAARIAAAAAAAASNKKPVTTGARKSGAAPASRTPPKKSSSASKKAAPKTPVTKKSGKTPASSASPPPAPPAFMTDEKYRSTLQKLTESMIRSQESRKCFQMKTDKTEKYARSKSVSKVLSSIEQSTRQIQTYLQGPAYGCGAISPPSSTSHHNHPPSQPPAQPRIK